MIKSKGEFISGLEETIQLIREIQSNASNLGTTLQYEHPNDIVYNSAISIARDSEEILNKLESILNYYIKRIDS